MAWISNRTAKTTDQAIHAKRDLPLVMVATREKNIMLSWCSFLGQIGREMYITPYHIPEFQKVWRDKKFVTGDYYYVSFCFLSEEDNIQNFRF